MIYAMEPIAYYFDMKPNEFWNGRYIEISIYCQVHLIKIIDDLKRNINLQEATTNKLIMADRIWKKPKIVLIRDSYKDLFKDEQEKRQSPKEVTRRMREIMKAEKEKR